MKNLSHTVVLFTFVLLSAFLHTNLFAQQNTPVQTNAKVTLTVKGEVTKPLSLDKEALAKLKTTNVRAKDRDGKEHQYTGVAFSDLLQEAGVTLGQALRGENLAKYVLVQAADGYEAVFALPELDPEFAKEPVLIAYLADEKPLAAGEGPFRIVVPADKKHARWVREVVAIKVLFAKD